MHLPPAHIVPDLQSAERFGAIGELVDRLVRADAVPVWGRDAVFEALAERERIMSTGVGFGFALPHANSEILSEPVVAFGRSRTGVDFEGHDGIRIEMFFLFVVPKGASSHVRSLKILREIATAFSRLGKAGGREALRRCSTAEEISALLNSESDNEFEW